MWMIGHLFSLRGVTPERPVVVYESDSGLRAARAFWFLEYLGHPDVAVLDGGVVAWLAAGRSRHPGRHDARAERLARHARTPRSSRRGSRFSTGSARTGSAIRRYSKRRRVLRRGRSGETRRRHSRAPFISSGSRTSPATAGSSRLRSLRAMYAARRRHFRSRNCDLLPGRLSGRALAIWPSSWPGFENVRNYTGPGRNGETARTCRSSIPRERRRSRRRRRT